MFYLTLSFLVCFVQETWRSPASKHRGGDDGAYYCRPAWKPDRIPGQVCRVHARGRVSSSSYILIRRGGVTAAATRDPRTQSWQSCVTAALRTSGGQSPVLDVRVKRVQVLCSNTVVTHSLSLKRFASPPTIASVSLSD